jgi:type VI secretion system protein ImpE
MVNAKQLIESGNVRQALEALAAHLREKPTDAAARTTMFEALCVAGEFERAQKHLNLLADSSEQAKMGAILYFSALHAEQERHALYKAQTFPKTTVSSHVTGKLNGKPFREIRDADNDLGARLEVFGAGQYIWVPFEHIRTLNIEAPKRWRDTFWTPGFLKTGPRFKGADMGEVLLPAIYPFSWTFEDQSVMLGRQTVWVEDDGGYKYPLGQKMLLVDGEEVPFLEVRLLEIDQPESDAAPEPEPTEEVHLNA